VQLVEIEMDDPAEKLELFAGLVIPMSGALFELPMTMATAADIDTAF
jgi:hypothetical protein